MRHSILLEVFAMALGLYDTTLERLCRISTLCFWFHSHFSQLFFPRARRTCVGNVARCSMLDPVFAGEINRVEVKMTDRLTSCLTTACPKLRRWQTTEQTNPSTQAPTTLPTTGNYLWKKLVWNQNETTDRRRKQNAFSQAVRVHREECGKNDQPQWRTTLFSIDEGSVFLYQWTFDEGSHQRQSG